MLSEKNIRRILAHRTKSYLTDPKLKKAAVLIPIFLKDNEYYLLFTKRTDDVSYHKGQISFPGGRQNPEEDPLTTALREAQEELGILQADITILGELDDMFTVSSDFIISPFVGLIPYPYSFKINSREVSEIIEIPILAISNPLSWRQESIEKNGHPLPIYFFQYQDFLIWGATARILKQLIDLILEKDNH